MSNHDNPKHGLKSRTIKKFLYEKVNDWLKTIDDADLRDRCKRETIVTGGCIASMLLGERVNDVDIYFRTKETVRAVADYYVKKFLEIKKVQGGIQVPLKVEELKDLQGRDRIRVKVQSAGIAGSEATKDYNYFESRQEDQAGDYVTEVYESKAPTLETGDKPDYSPCFISSNAISLKGQVQLILRFYGNPEEIHGNYDFVHCKNYWESAGDQLTLNADALEALLSRTLVYQGSQYPICSIIRARKFIERGWRINAGQYLKMAMQISDLNLTDYLVLEEQLTGVDVAYFAEILTKLHDHNPEKIDTTYLVEIINRMFD